MEIIYIGGFKWVENTSQFSKDFVENCNKYSVDEYFLEVGVQHPEKLHDLQNWKRWKTCMIKEYVIHKKNLKQGLNHGLVLKKVHSHYTLSRSLIKTILQYEHRAKKIRKKRIQKQYFQVDE